MLFAVTQDVSPAQVKSVIRFSFTKLCRDRRKDPEPLNLSEKTETRLNPAGTEAEQYNQNGELELNVFALGEPNTSYYPNLDCQTQHGPLEVGATNCHGTERLQTNTSILGNPMNIQGYIISRKKIYLDFLIRS